MYVMMWMFIYRFISRNEVDLGFIYHTSALGTHCMQLELEIAHVIQRDH